MDTTESVNGFFKCRREGCSTAGATPMRVRAAVPFLAALFSAFALLLPAAAIAQKDYPAGPVRIVNPFPPGGSSDAAARILAEALSREMGQQFVVENRGGAQGNIGVASVAKAPPDGHALVFASASAFTINPYLYVSQGFDPKNDLAPVIVFGSVPIVLTVNPKLPVQTLVEFTQYARDHPGKLNFSSAGNGSSMHLAGELFQKMSGTTLQHVPYVSGAQAATDTIAGHVQVVFHLLPAVVQHINAGSLRAIALLASTRSSALPSVPTTREAGMPGLEADAAYFIMAPKGTPGQVVLKLNAAINQLLQAPAFRERVVGLGITPMGGKPEDVTRLIAIETERWAEFLKRIGKVN
jgi:tripartite-type tricarboxylate transporter receptor subunit TctC